MKSIQIYLLIALVTLINVFIQIANYHSHVEKGLQAFEVKTLHHLESLEALFQDYFAPSFLTALTLSQSKLTTQENTDQSIVENTFLFAIQNEPTITQIRFIDTQGMEKLRVQRDAFGAPVELVTEKDLQNKSHRDYVQKGLQLPENDFFWSSINLNRENGMVEHPIKPTRRIVMPVFNNESRMGIIVVNVCLKRLRSLVDDFTDFPLYLIDSKNHFKWHPNPSKEWTKDLNLADRATDLLSEENIYTQGIRNSDMQFIVDKSYDIEVIRKTHQNEEWFNGIVIQVIVLILLFIGYQVQTQRHLNSSFKQQAQQLKKKQELLAKQSRNALMGEMLAMIAHQWRQPLNVIKLNATFLRSQVTKNEHISSPQAKVFNKAIENITAMVNEQDATIADFRDFYQPSKKIETFAISDSIEASLHLLSNLIHSSAVELKLDINGFGLTGVEREFRQVITNLIKNAIDEHIARKIAHPVIQIQSTVERDELVIRISDNAGGIDENVIEKLFEAYVSTKSLNGTGLGLYMSQMIIETTFAGHITAYNNAKGAVFELRFKHFKENIHE